MQDLYQHQPCHNCPYTKKSLKGWLGKARAEELVSVDSFVCHKTLGEGQVRKQCAGHMLLMEDKNEFVKIAGRMKIALELKGRETVFDTDDEFIQHHS